FDRVAVGLAVLRGVMLAQDGPARQDVVDVGFGPRAAAPRLDAFFHKPLDYPVCAVSANRPCKDTADNGSPCGLLDEPAVHQVNPFGPLARHGLPLFPGEPSGGIPMVTNAIPFTFALRVSSIKLDSGNDPVRRRAVLVVDADGVPQDG